MNENLVESLKQHLNLCDEALQLAQHENESLRQTDERSQFETCQRRKQLLPKITESLENLRRHRSTWQRMSSEERASQPEALSLMRQNQDLLMRILVLDRENEQRLLRKGLVPSRHIPPAAAQKPHFVADLYRRSRLGCAHAD